MIAAGEGGDIGPDAEQQPDEILEMGREVQQQRTLRRRLKAVGKAAPGQQPSGQRLVGGGEMIEKRPVDAGETVRLIEIGKTEAEAESKRAHHRVRGTRGHRLS